MSSFNILRFFQLKGGCRVTHQKPHTNFPTHHAHYNTNIWCTNSTITADLRIHITSTTPLLPDGTGIFAVWTAQSTIIVNPPHTFLNLDALTFVIIPGDPNSDRYDAHLPDERTSMVYGLGRVTGSAQTLDDGHSSRVVTVAVPDYVRDETRVSTLQCVFDMSTACWTMVPIPRTNSGMQFYGICRDFTPAGVFRVKILSVALNVAANSSAPSAETQQPPRESTSAPVTPAKRRKFSPSPPSSVATDP
ncbi:hypothetical protein DFH08DRAFT_671426, partial [Mycena albidolilacea]